VVVQNGFAAWANVFDATEVAAGVSGSLIADSIVSPATLAALQKSFTPFSINASLASAGIVAGWFVLACGRSSLKAVTPHSHTSHTHTRITSPHTSHAYTPTIPPQPSLSMDAVAHHHDVMRR
jgi:hypothetical protein